MVNTNMMTILNTQKNTKVSMPRDEFKTKYPMVFNNQVIYKDGLDFRRKRLLSKMKIKDVCRKLEMEPMRYSQIENGFERPDEEELENLEILFKDIP